jgi:guanine deaminase
MMKEALQAYLMQRLSPDGALLSAGDLLYLSTLAGAEALGLQEEIGDFTTGKSADLAYLRPASGTVLESVLKHSEGPEHTLSALFTMADGVTVNEVRVEGAPVYRSSSVS